MKKIIIFILIFLNINLSFAFMPLSLTDIIIGKIENVNEFININNRKWYSFNFKNYINNKFNDNILENLKTIIDYRKNLLNKNTVILQNQIPNNSNLKEWDIIAISRYSWRDWILKIWCKNNLMYIEWIKNKVFLSAFENWKNRVYINEVNKYKRWTELFILKRFNKKVWWCTWLKTFFNQDRTFEDIDWFNFKKYFYFLIVFIWILSFILIKKLWKK